MKSSNHDCVTKLSKHNFDPSLYLIVTVTKGESIEYVLPRIKAAIQGGVSVVQLRAKFVTNSEYIVNARKVKQYLAPYQIPLVINDRVDVAIAAEINSLHLGQSDISPVQAKKQLGENSIIGLSIENFEQAKCAIQLPVDYVVISPIFLTNSKPELTNAWGLDGAANLREMIAKPLLAIGGITEHNVREVLRAGVDGVCVQSAIMNSEDPYRAALSIREIIDDQQYKSVSL